MNDEVMTAPVTGEDRPPMDSNQQYLRAIYTLRCIESKHMKSQSGNRMIRLTWEVIAPETAETVNGRFTITGLQCMNFLMLEPEYLGNTKAFLRKVSLPTDIDPDSEDTEMFRDLMVKAIAQSKLKEQMGQEIRDGKVVNVKLLGEDGKPLTSWRFEFNLADTICRYEGDAPAY